MKKIVVLLMMIITFSCAKNHPEVYIKYANGYWEIDEVTLSDGTKREYSFNDTIDYIEISDSLTGFRRKLKPNLFGKYETSRSVETFSMKIENDSLNVYYQTPYANWKETILDADEMHLLVVNADNNVYLYKRYQPLELD